MPNIICKTCKEDLDQELGCVNCFCIQYWNLNDSSIPSDIKHLREETIEFGRVT